MKEMQMNSQYMQWNWMVFAWMYMK